MQNQKTARKTCYQWQTSLIYIFNWIDFVFVFVIPLLLLRTTPKLDSVSRNMRFLTFGQVDWLHATILVLPTHFSKLITSYFNNLTSIRSKHLSNCCFLVSKLEFFFFSNWSYLDMITSNNKNEEIVTPQEKIDDSGSKFPTREIVGKDLEHIYQSKKKKMKILYIWPKLIERV